MKAEETIMVKFTHDQISPHIIRIIEPGVYCYLVKGTEKALLIDTGWGIGDLRGYAENLLRGLPYTVAVSHCHVDHVNGAGLFDEVYMSEKDWFMYDAEYDLQHRKNDLKMFGRNYPEMADIVMADFNCKRTDPFLPLHDGDVFDLGGVHVRAVSVPGHTAGMTMFLIEEDRIMFYGDGCTKHTFMFTNGALSIREYLAGLRYLKTYDDCYDTVIRSHNIYTQPKHILDENIELCELILADQDARRQTVTAGTVCYEAALTDEKGQRIDGKTANLYYTDANL